MDRPLILAGALALVWVWRRDPLAALVIGLVALSFAVGEDARSW